MNLVQEKARQRNITPNFLRFQSTGWINLGKSTNGSSSKNVKEDDKMETQIPTERSASRTSRCSFDVY